MTRVHAAPVSRKKRPLSVAILVYNFDAMGGMERQATRLAERLRSKGVRVTVITTFFPPGTWLPARPRIHERRQGFEIVRVPFFSWVPYDPARRLFEAVAGFVLLRRRSIDVVYAVQYTSAHHAVRATRVLARPVVAKFACGGAFGDFEHLRGQKDATAIRVDLAAVDRYVCISDALEAEAIENGLDRSRFVRIRNGVDLARFSADVAPAPIPELGASSKRQVILFVGRHDHQKRVAILLRAFALVARRFPEARLASVGTGPLEAELHSLAASLGVAAKVAFLGSRNDIVALHRAASVFVLPSAAEGIPNVLLEALAAGTPSVATDIPGTNELVRHEREALLVPVDDAPALARAIERLLEDQALAARLAAAGRERVAAEFDLDQVTDRYIELFSSLKRRRARLRHRDLAAMGASFVKTLALVAHGVAIRVITAVVVTTKGWLGIEGDLLPGRRPVAQQ